MAHSKAPIHGLFIDGKSVAATRPDLLDVINPATGELLAQSRGNALITVTTVDPKKQATCMVTVA